MTATADLPVDRRRRAPPLARALGTAATDHAAMAQTAITALNMLSSRTADDVHERGQKELHPSEGATLSAV